MKLPNLDRVTIPEAKLTRYLLSVEHPDGRSKAAFFRGLGFSPERWSVFASALVVHADLHEVSSVETSEYGTRNTIDGSIETPDSRNPSIRSVWFIEDGGTNPRFVTAYPLRRRRR